LREGNDVERPSFDMFFQLEIVIGKGKVKRIEVKNKKKKSEEVFMNLPTFLFIFYYLGMFPALIFLKETPNREPSTIFGRSVIIF